MGLRRSLITRPLVKGQIRSGWARSSQCGSVRHRLRRPTASSLFWPLGQTCNSNHYEILARIIEDIDLHRTSCVVNNEALKTTESVGQHERTLLLKKLSDASLPLELCAQWMMCEEPAADPMILQELDGEEIRGVRA